MKYLLFASLSLFVMANVNAQKKPAAKPAAKTNAEAAAPAKEAAASSTAMQAVYMVSGTPEEFKKFATDARSSYDAGKLDDSRFAMQQMLAELDVIIGKEV